MFSLHGPTDVQEKNINCFEITLGHVLCSFNHNTALGINHRSGSSIKVMKTILKVPQRYRGCQRIAYLSSTFISRPCLGLDQLGAWRPSYCSSYRISPFPLVLALLFGSLIFGIPSHPDCGDSFPGLTQTNPEPYLYLRNRLVITINMYTVFLP